MNIRDAPQLVLRFTFRFSNDGIAGDPELERRQIVPCAASPQIRDFFADALRRITVHQIGVTLFGDQLFCRGRLAARMQRWPWLRSRLWLEDIIFHAVILPGIRKMVLLPNSIQNVEPLAGARVAVVMLFERDAILARFVRPPRGNHVQRKPAIADLIDVGRLLREQRRQMKSRPYRHHQFDSLGYRGQCRRRGPGIKRRGFGALDIVEIELRDQRQVESNLLAALRKPLHVRPAYLHVFVFHIAQPAAENGKPVAVSHRGPPLTTARSGRLAWCFCASVMRKSASRAYGLKPMTRTGSATKLESAFTS